MSTIQNVEVATFHAQRMCIVTISTCRKNIKVKLRMSFPKNYPSPNEIPQYVFDAITTIDKTSQVSLFIPLDRSDVRKGSAVVSKAASVGTSAKQEEIICWSPHLAPGKITACFQLNQ